MILCRLRPVAFCGNEFLCRLPRWLSVALVAMFLLRLRWGRHRIVRLETMFPIECSWVARCKCFVCKWIPSGCRSSAVAPAVASVATVAVAAAGVWWRWRWRRWLRWRRWQRRWCLVAVAVAAVASVATVVVVPVEVHRQCWQRLQRDVELKLRTKWIRSVQRTKRRAGHKISQEFDPMTLIFDVQFSINSHHSTLEKSALTSTFTCFSL